MKCKINMPQTILLASGISKTYILESNHQLLWFQIRRRLIPCLFVIRQLQIFVIMMQILHIEQYRFKMIHHILAGSSQCSQCRNIFDYFRSCDHSIDTPDTDHRIGNHQKQCLNDQITNPDLFLNIQLSILNIAFFIPHSGHITKQ